MARRQILSLSERESLLALPENELTLTRMAYFSEQDLVFINVHRKPAIRFGFAVLLCYLKNIGFAPDKKSSPPAEFLKIIGSRLKLSSELWQEYISGRDTTRREQLGELYRYLELKAFNGAFQKECIQHLFPLSTRTDRGILIAEELLKHLHQRRIIIPGIDVVERTCAEAMTQGDKAVYTTLNAHLGITHKSALDALRAGDIWGWGSRRYKNIDDYFMSGDDFEKLLNNNQLNLPVETECGAYLKARLTLLAFRLEEVNAMVAAGDLPDVDISDKGVKITPLDNSVPSTVSPLAELIYNMLPHFSVSQTEPGENTQELQENIQY